jgi:hypothetical protein
MYSFKKLAMPAEAFHALKATNNFTGEGWCAWQDSNLQPTVPKTGALSIELQARTIYFKIIKKRVA